jgi:hypothetical protein
MDGREIYFHRNSVVNDAFEDVDIGRQVRLVVDERQSERGPPATTVELIGKSHLHDQRPEAIALIQRSQYTQERGDLLDLIRYTRR